MKNHGEGNYGGSKGRKGRKGFWDRSRIFLLALAVCREADSCLLSIVRKTFRILFLIAMMLGLAAGQALPIAVCGNTDPCGDCCKAKGAACCKKDPAPARSTPSQIAASSVDLKQAIMPVLLICLGTQPVMVIPPVAMQKRISAQLSIQRRVDVTCIRLI